MKRIYFIISLFIMSLALTLSVSCKKFLKQQVFTQYDPETFLQTTQGIESLLNASYSRLYNGSLLARDYLTINAMPTDILWDYGGGYVNIATLYTNFKWDSQEGILSKTWGNYYIGIRNANSLLDNIHLAESSLSEDEINKFKAEAKFIRAADYYYLWQIFGPVPLVTTTDSLNLSPSRPSADDFNAFITSELQYAADNLPLTQDIWGKATKGAALAQLGEYYLNTHQWQKAADVNKQVMDLNIYDLYAGDIKYQFAVKNEQNSSVIFAAPAIPQKTINAYMPHAFPPKYPIQSNWVNWGTQFCIYNSFYKTYNPNDKRLEWFLTHYTDVDGVYHNLLDPNDPGRSVRCFKYWPDPNAISQSHGNDIVLIRYAEVLLNRSEALNEINGPNQESVDLLNKIRNRAGISEYSLSGFPTKESFREAILKERGWEFVCESKRRMDLIRQGQLIPTAKARGIEGAKKYMTIYPIPQQEIDANPNLKQNPGY